MKVNKDTYEDVFPIVNLVESTEESDRRHFTKYPWAQEKGPPKPRAAENGLYCTAATRIFLLLGFPHFLRMVTAPHVAPRLPFQYLSSFL